MPKTTVAAIVTNLDKASKEILLTHRKIQPFKDQWCLPGGHIDKYEKVPNAIIREVKEETGLNFDAQFFGYFDEIIPEHNIHAVVLVFEGPGKGTLVAQRDEVSDIRWFSMDKARSLSLAFTHNEILDKYASQLNSSAMNIEPKNQEILDQANGNKSDELKSEVLAEYSALRNEMLQRIDMRQQILTFALVIAGTLLAFGLQTTIILLIYPILALFLANVWVQHDIRIGEIAKYIGKEIEPVLKGVKWETYISEIYRGRNFRLVEFNALGLFLAVSILSIILAVPQLTFSLDENLLLVSDVIALILTLIVVRGRRRTFKK